MKHTHTISLAAVALSLAGCATQSPTQSPMQSTQPVAAAANFAPIIMVHGNGDNASVWQTTLWRFEANGWPANRLFAVNMPNPLSRDDDTVAQAGRSSVAEQAAFLQAQIDAVKASTGAAQVVLLGNSRGGNAIRTVIQAQADANQVFSVSHAVLGGTPNHGVWAEAALRPNNEFNGAGPFLTRLNAPKGAAGVEATPGVKWLTLRSDGNDKFAQADGRWIGSPGKPTFVNTDGPALTGATNVLLPGVDHRETSFGPAAFAQTWPFLTGLAPKMTLVPRVAGGQAIVLDGLVSGLTKAGATNLPLSGAKVEVFAVNPASGERLGAAAHTRSIGADGRWGPFSGNSLVAYEFVLTPPANADLPYATVHTYRSPFARSSSVVSLKADVVAAADKDAGSVVTMARPRGYFGLGRDTMLLDNLPLAGVAVGVAGVAASKRKLSPDTAVRSIKGEFNGEIIQARTWPTKENRLVVIELTD